MEVTEGKYDYEPFGKKMTVLNNKNRLTFIGKENDFESNFGDFGVRKYDDETGRFTSIDPLWEKFYGLTPYHYCYNNPVRLLDNNGKLPGDPFGSAEEAAHDFAKNYNPVSGVVKMDISTTIYKFTNDAGEVQFTYAIPNAFSKEGSNADESIIDKPGYEKVGEVHAHGPDDVSHEHPDDFSTRGGSTRKGDYGRAAELSEKKQELFLVGPSGTLKVIENGKSKTLSSDLPKATGDKAKDEKQINSGNDKRPLLLKMFVDGVHTMQTFNMRKKPEQKNEIRVHICISKIIFKIKWIIYERKVQIVICFNGNSIFVLFLRKTERAGSTRLLRVSA